ncbi:MAG: hypothetical protein H8F28_24320 [Fibrella sp.]|nr:hypothetical protein [Armatimonadota bacterium]
MKLTLAVLAVTAFTVPTLAAPLQKTTKPSAKRSVAAKKTTTKPQTANQKPSVATKIGFPQDAGAHDANAAIEWWYFNAFLKTASGKNYAVVGSFFRIGLQPTKKGHYLIYSLTDLDEKRVVADGSVLDKANVALLKSYLPLVAMSRPDDKSIMPLLAALQKDQLPAPHRITAGETQIKSGGPRFSISMDDRKYLFAQEADDARKWKAELTDPAFSVNLILDQPKATRPAMLVGGEGKTGLGSPDDMFYVSLTRPAVRGTLTVGSKTESVTGTGWVDRQWGRSWVVGDNGWDWFGVQLGSGEDLIVYRVKDNSTGRVLRAEATLLRADGTQTVDKDVTFTPSGEWLDPKSGIAFPHLFAVSMKNIGYTLTFTPTFDAQAIPTLGIGTAFWEGVVDVTGTAKDGSAITGRGYRELVGYKPKATPKAETITQNNP